MLLTAHAQGRHVIEPPNGVDGLSQGPPPPIRMNLSAIGMRSPPLTHQSTGNQIPNNDLARLRRRINTSGQSHGAFSLETVGLRGERVTAPVGDRADLHRCARSPVRSPSHQCDNREPSGKPPNQHVSGLANPDRAITGRLHLASAHQLSQ
ncbi:hypothetical protein CHIBA101_0545 [Actinomyces sp. Chiba101]|nr:hypothetical protein CHIBA101_0545 [Actinomyces sp. Chiba101]GAV94644.1 hypothetical protein ADENT20671_1414 [Actinomyces denticolens]